MLRVVAVAEDLFDEMLRDIAKALRRMQALRERFESYIEEVVRDFENLYEERVRSMTSDVEEPLVEIRDFGDELVMVVDVSGVKDESVDVRVTSEEIVVAGEVDERKVEEALRGWHLARTKKVFRGVYKLPQPIDPSSVKVYKKDSLIIIRARKISL